MKVNISEDSQRMLMLLKLDAKRVYERIRFRAPEYLSEFSLKRTREHFKEIFTNRYDVVTIKELLLVGQEVIVGLDQFYSKIDEMRWYVNHTQDMPSRVEDKIHSHIRELTTYFETLNLYIDVEMGLIQEAKDSEVSETSEELMSSVNEENFIDNCGMQFEDSIEFKLDENLINTEE